MKKKIVNIAKEIVALTAKYKYYSSEQGLILTEKFEEYKNILTPSDDKYIKKIITLIDDVLEDIKNGSPLQIDSLKEDDEIHAYLLSKREYKIYSELIDEKIYKSIIQRENKTSDIDIFLDNFLLTLSKLSPDIISKNLLIFNHEDKIEPKKYLERLWIYRKKLSFTTKQNKKLYSAIILYDKLLRQVKFLATQRLLSNTFSSKYIEVSHNNQSANSSLTFTKKDASIGKYKTGNPKLEYFKLIQDL